MALMSGLPEPYYQDDHVTIYHADCLDLLPLILADVMVTDPPYGIGWSKGENKAANSKRHSGIVNDESTATRDNALELWGNRPAAIFGSFAAIPPVGTKQTLVYQKPNDSGVVGSTNGYRRDVEPIYVIGSWPKRSPTKSSVLRSKISNVGGSSSPAGRTGHPHAKPPDLMRELILAIGPGVILDPFMGSGTTLRAAKDLNRKAIGIEIEEKYCEIAARRMGQEVLNL